MKSCLCVLGTKYVLHYDRKSLTFPSATDTWTVNGEWHQDGMCADVEHGACLGPGCSLPFQKRQETSVLRYLK